MIVEMIRQSRAIHTLKAPQPSPSRLLLQSHIWAQTCGLSRLGWSLIEERMKQMKAAGMHRIGLVDASPTLYAFHRGAQLAGLQVRAIYDDALAGVLPSYRETPIQDLNAGLAEPLDALMVSNANYAQAVGRTRYLRARTVRPVFNWFTPPGVSSTDDVIEPSVFDRPSPM